MGIFMQISGTNLNKTNLEIICSYLNRSLQSHINNFENDIHVVRINMITNVIWNIKICNCAVRFKKQNKKPADQVKWSKP